MAALFVLLLRIPGANFIVRGLTPSASLAPAFAARVTNEVPVVAAMQVDKWYAYHRRATVTCTIYARTQPENRQAVQDAFKARRNEVDDAVRTVIGRAELADLRDPQLRYVKENLHERLEQITGPGTVEEILIPEWHAARAR